MPSLYETTAIVGDVSSSNFTTLYNSSGLTAPNSGGGAVSGNLNVAGNLTVQGTSLLVGAVALQSTLSLPNYTFPAADGTTDQVLTTDGSGNLYFTSVAALGASYVIQANAATGGADLALVSSTGITDSVKFEGTGGVTVSRIDSNTIQIDAAEPLPAGTKGDMLYYDGTDWTADNNISADTSGQRAIFTYENSAAGANAPLRVRKDYGATTYTQDDGVSITYQLASDTQPASGYGSHGFLYKTSGEHLFFLTTSTDNFATSNNILVVDATNLAVEAGTLTLNKDVTGSPSANASIVVERGSSTDASLTWDETDDRWEFTNDVYVTGVVRLDGDTLYINNDNTSITSTVSFGNGKTLSYNPSPSPTSDGPFIFNDSLCISKTQPYLTFSVQPDGANSLYGVRGKSTVDDPWFVGGGSTGNDGGYMEIATGDNATTPGSASPIYVRQYGGELGGTVPWYGGTETPVTTLTLLDGSGNTLIPNDLAVNVNSLFVDASTGYVGVGTNTPSFNLDVQGNAQVTGNIDVSSITIDSRAGMNTNTVATTSTSTVAISSTTRNVLKTLVYIVDNVTSAVHTVETLILRNGATAMLTTYGEMYSASALATFTADVSGGLIRLLATPASSNNTTIDIVGVGLT